MKVKFHRFAKYSACAALCATATVATHAGHFKNIVETIVVSAPSVQSSRAAMQAELESARGVNILDNPEIEFEYLWNSRHDENDRWNISLKQSVPTPAVWKARSKVARTTSLLGVLQYQADSLDLSLQVSELLIKLVSARKELNLQKKIRQNNEELLSLYTKAWESGETTILDLDKLRIEALRNSSSLTETFHDVESIIEQLECIASPEVDVANLVENLDEYPIELQLLSEDNYMDNVASYPAVLSAHLKSQLASEQFSAAKTESYWPGLSAGYVHAFEEGIHFNGLTVSMTLPIYSREHAIRSASSSVSAAMFNAIDVETSVRSRVSTAYEEAEHHQLVLDNYGKMLETTNHLSLLRKALDGGEISLITYIQEVNYFVDALLDYNRLQCDYHLILASLNQFR